MIIFHSKLPHIPKPIECLLILYADVILFHCLSTSIISFPDLAIPIVKDGVMLGFWEYWVRCIGAHSFCIELANIILLGYYSNK